MLGALGYNIPCGSLFGIPIKVNGALLVLCADSGIMEGCEDVRPTCISKIPALELPGAHHIPVALHMLSLIHI